MGVLHTKSSYALEKIENITLFNENKDVNFTYLKEQERKLYRKFETDNYEDFIKKLRELFDPKVKEVLARFEPKNLSKEIENYTRTTATIFRPGAVFKFDFSQLDKVKFDLKVTNKALELKGGTIDAVLGANDKALRDFVHKYFKGHKYTTEKEWSDYLTSFIKKLSLEGDFLTVYEKGPSSETEVLVPVKLSEIPNFPWGVLKEDIENAEALGQGSEMAKELSRALDSIKNFIFNILGGDAPVELKGAMELVWKNHFDNKKLNPLLFFRGGTKSNFISGVQGALGEFQTAVIFEYLDNQIQDKAMAHIMGSYYRNNEQLRTDVQIFNEIGIQVKNFNNAINQNGGLEFFNNRRISSTIHPVDFSKYLPGGVNNHFLDFLANYYFNISYQEQVTGDFEQIIKELGEYLGEIMNFSMSQVLKDTFCFYMVGGKYLIPASEILEMAEDINLKDSIEITSSYKGKDDEEYKELKQGTFKMRPAYIDYWHKSLTKWYPTGKNKALYNELVNKKISIRTHFNLIEHIERYALY